MRYEGKSEEEAVAEASRQLGRAAGELGYRVVRDERSFWGGRIVEIEVETGGAAGGPSPAGAAREAAREEPRQPPAPERAERTEGAEVAPREEEGAALDPEAFSAAETTLTELLSAAGFLVEIRRQPSTVEMIFELMGDDVEPLLANRGEGLSGLEVLTGRIASKKLGRPVHPRLDAEGFRAHQKESLEELAMRSAEEAKRTRRPQLLPPLSPGERRLVHLALAADPDVETESEGEGFLKRVAVKLKSG
jgi:spoIIIJ-associated protein